MLEDFSVSTGSSFAKFNVSIETLLNSAIWDIANCVPECGTGKVCKNEKNLCAFGVTTPSIRRALS